MQNNVIGIIFVSRVRNLYRLANAGIDITTGALLLRRDNVDVARACRAVKRHLERDIESNVALFNCFHRRTDADWDTRCHV